MESLNHAFAKIPMGVHTLCGCVVGTLNAALISFIIRRVVSTIAPFESIFVGFLTVIFQNIFFSMVKFIPVKDKRTGQTKRWAIGTWFMPASHRFDLKARADLKRVLQTGYVLITFTSILCFIFLFITSVR